MSRLISAKEARQETEETIKNNNRVFVSEFEHKYPKIIEFVNSKINEAIKTKRLTTSFTYVEFISKESSFEEFSDINDIMNKVITYLRNRGYYVRIDSPDNSDHNYLIISWDENDMDNISNDSIVLLNQILTYLKKS